MDKYEGRRGVVVGGTQGVGLAIAEELVGGGAQVVVTGRDPDKARAAEEALGPAASAIVSDVTDAQDMQRWPSGPGISTRPSSTSGSSSPSRLPT